jgi:hypothetical protein
LALLELAADFECGQRTKFNLSDLIVETLEEIENSGGLEAFMNIKYMIPMYQSCLVGGGT